MVTKDEMFDIIENYLTLKGVVENEEARMHVVSDDEIEFRKISRVLDIIKNSNCMILHLAELHDLINSINNKELKSICKEFLTHITDNNNTISEIAASKIKNKKDKTEKKSTSVDFDIFNTF